MKTRAWVAMAVCVLALAACGTVWAQSGRAARKTRVAVFPFEVTGGVVNADEAVFIREDFSNRLAQTGLFELVPRAEVDKLFRREAAFQLNDLSDAAKTAEYGRVLNADWIMAGRLGRVGSRLALIVTMYTYPDFVQKPGSQVYAPDIDTLVDNLPDLISGIQAAHGDAAAPAAAAAGVGASGAPPAAPPAKPAAAAAAYQIGDTGPAGGIVFYDKGNDSDGWRYLEAAPVTTEWQDIQWGPQNSEIRGTRTELGTGKRNTQLIVDYATRMGGNFRAAWSCDALQSGGYSDWFLPSKAELNLMYLNLRERGLGDFVKEWYWSSSESGDSTAWTQGFGNGNQRNDLYGSWMEPYGAGRKDIGHNVRAIRQF